VNHSLKLSTREKIWLDIFKSCVPTMAGSQTYIQCLNTTDKLLQEFDRRFPRHLKAEATDESAVKPGEEV